MEEKGNSLDVTGDDGKEPLESLCRLPVSRKEAPVHRQLLNTCCNFHPNLHHTRPYN